MDGKWVVTIEWPDLVGGQVKQRKILISDDLVQAFYAKRPVDKDTGDQLAVLYMAEHEVLRDPKPLPKLDHWTGEVIG